MTSLSTENLEKKTAPHQKATAVRDPSPKYRCRTYTPPDRMIILDPDLSQAASQSRKGTNAWGPRHIRRWTPPHFRRLEETPHAGASPQHSTSQIRFRSGHQDRGGVAPLPRASKEQSCPNRRPTSSRCSTCAIVSHHHASKPKSSLAPSSDDVSHRSSPAELSHPPQFAASQVVARCRCSKRRRLTLSRIALTIA